MGRRGRARGFTEAAVRAARRATNEKDPRAHEIAQEVYNEVLEWRDADGPDLMAPACVTARLAAGAVAESTKCTPQEAAEYLAGMFMFVLMDVTPERIKAYHDARRTPEAAPLI